MKISIDFSIFRMQKTVEFEFRHLFVLVYELSYFTAEKLFNSFQTISKEVFNNAWSKAPEFVFFLI